MKRKIKILLNCLVTIILLMLVLGKLSDLLQKKSSDSKYESFFEQEEDFDVLFMGTSHVINGVYPMELWNDYGIVSYNFGGHQNTMASTYWVMENALDYTSPELIVIDCYGLSTEVKIRENFSFAHLSFDAFPLSTTKIKAAFDLLDDPVMDEMIENGEAKITGESRSVLGLLWDYSVYHSRWSSLEENDFVPVATEEKGAESRIGVSVPDEILSIDKNQKAEGYNVSYEYLEKMIESCQEREIEVLLMFLPFPAPESDVLNSNRVYDIAEEYGVNYINFLNMDVINYNTDCYDKNSHLNPSGARKVTSYLGEYISEHYDIENQKENEKYSSWYDDYQIYTEFKYNNLQQEESLLNYLMLIAEDNIDAVIEINDKAILEDSQYVQLLENLGVKKEELSKDTVTIVVENGGESVMVLADYQKDSNTLDLANGVHIVCSDSITGNEIDDVQFQYVLNENGENPELVIVNVERIK